MSLKQYAELCEVGVCYNSVTLGFVDVWQYVIYMIQYAVMWECNSVTQRFAGVWQYVIYIIQYAGLC